MSFFMELKALILLSKCDLTCGLQIRVCGFDSRPDLQMPIFLFLLNGLMDRLATRSERVASRLHASFFFTFLSRSDSIALSDSRT